MDTVKPNSPGRWRARLPLILLSGVVLLVVLIGIQLILPGNSLDTTPNGARIHLAASRFAVPGPGSCFTLQWSLDGIQTVYLGDEGLPGSGERELCISHYTAEQFNITLKDGTALSYTLVVRVLSNDPLTWLMVFFVLLMALGTVYLTVWQRLLTGLKPIVRWVATATRPVVVSLVGVVVTLLIIEIGMRIYFTYFGTEDDRIKYVYSADDIQNIAGRFTGLPFIGYGPSPTFPEDNQFGYRGAEVAIPKPAGVFRIVSLGASTTYGFGVKPDEAYPAQLQQILRDQYGYTNVEVVNAGVLGYTTWESLTNLEFKVLELQPNLVIYYEAINDVDQRMYTDPGCFGGIQPLRGLSVLHGMWKTQYDQIFPSALYRFIAINLGWMKNPTALDFAFDAPTVQADCQSATPVTQEQALAANPPIYYERNLRNIIAIAQANGVKVMISRWIYPTSKLVSFALPDYMLQAAEDHNAIAKKLADEMGVPYYDLAADFKYGADEWWTGVHMTAKGLHQQASLYAAYLIKQNLLPKP